MSTKLFEHAFYIGGYIAGIVQGAELVLYFETVYALLKKPKSSFRRSDIFFLCWSTALAILVACCNSTNAVWGERMWITDRDKPGGIPEYIETQQTVWYQDLGTTASVALLLMNDALMIWRCFIVWGSNRWVIAIPLTVYLISIPLAIVELLSSFEPSGSVFTGNALKFGTAYYTLTITLNVILTALICGRLLSHARYIRTTPLAPDASDVYHNIAAILIESAVPYTLIGIAFLIPYAMSSEISIAFGEIWGSVMGISQQLIILRVVTRKSWEKTVQTHPHSAISFAPNTETAMSDFTKGTATTDQSATLAFASREWDPSEVVGDVPIVKV